MDKIEFQRFLYNNIPITSYMEITIVEFNEEKVEALAKLGPNKNHSNTAFGGSINSLATICGWAMTFANINPVDSKAHIVIQESKIKYLKPINNNFTARCVLEEKSLREEFIRNYTRKGKGRLKLNIFCYDGETLAAEMEARYVAYK